jgi:hypothetical protein
VKRILFGREKRLFMGVLKASPAKWRIESKLK